MIDTSWLAVSVYLSPLLASVMNSGHAILDL